MWQGTKLIPIIETESWPIYCQEQGASTQIEKLRKRHETVIKRTRPISNQARITSQGAFITRQWEQNSQCWNRQVSDGNYGIRKGEQGLAIWSRALYWMWWVGKGHVEQKRKHENFVGTGQH